MLSYQKFDKTGDIGFLSRTCYLDVGVGGRQLASTKRGEMCFSVAIKIPLGNKNLHVGNSKNVLIYKAWFVFLVGLVMLASVKPGFRNQRGLI